MAGPYQAPAYPMQIAGQWRVVVPIRGKLTPRVHAHVFSNRDEADRWVRSETGRQIVAEMRERRPAPRHAAEARA